jgi:hypothetical protein
LNGSLGDITLAHLETLILEYYSTGPVPLGIVAALTLPALQRFQIAETLFADKDDTVDSITALVTRSGCNLRELSITEANHAHAAAYHNAFPWTSLAFSSLDVTDPFLMRWQDRVEDVD